VTGRHEQACDARGPEAGPARPRPMDAHERRPVSPGAWVMIHRVVLEAGRRARGVPPETQAVPLEMRVKGFLTGGPARPGDTVTIRTVVGRRVKGTLVEENPPFVHGFGAPVAELAHVGPDLRRRLAAARTGGEDDGGGG